MKIRDWLIGKYLPAILKESVCKENKALRDHIGDLNAEIDRLNAYLDGLEKGIRQARRITIHNEVNK